MAAPHVADRAVGLQHVAYLVPRPVVAGLAKPFFNEHELQPNSAAHDVPPRVVPLVTRLLVIASMSSSLPHSVDGNNIYSTCTSQYFRSHLAQA